MTLSPTPSPSRFGSVLTMIRIIAAHGTRRSGDIAIHKADAFLGRMRPELAAALRRVEPVVPAIDLPALRSLPERSFGRAYARFLDDNGLHPFVVTELTSSQVMQRNLHWARYAVVHDMFHVLLNAGSDLAGEAKVYAFTLAQRISWVFWLYLPLAIVVMPLLAPHRFGAMVRGFRAGYAAGKRLPMLMAQRLEDRFGEGLEEVRAGLGLPAAGRTAGLEAAARAA
ncbi:Coq4 family protein [Paraliomyxa miuraensis]|uniref:Coq4 family protein n=1 Tax=Paraliomyxa miuraensis TaxID=376150 RepID=UPI00225A0080|nr:Coq4 family protein [Paraliomyxa miuraensis]MCX4239921.1 ubiquinone biosynthesis protein COQ4 [Paraliomyxa miuraensis]